MQLQFADLEFYKIEYLAGDTQLIPDASFVRRAREASQEINRRTFGRAETMACEVEIEVPIENNTEKFKPVFFEEEYETEIIIDYPVEIKSCMCELAEAYFANAESQSLESVQSQSISGTYSINYRDQRRRTDEFNTVISGILHKWLSEITDFTGTPLLYRG